MERLRTDLGKQALAQDVLAARAAEQRERDAAAFTVGRILTSPTRSLANESGKDTICATKMLCRRWHGYRLLLQAPNRW